MINDLLDLINSETIYLAANWGVIPFWLLLIIFPNHGVTNFFVQSIIAPLLLATAYGYLSYNLYLDNDILSGFKFYVISFSYQFTISNHMFSFCRYKSWSLNSMQIM